MTDAYNPATRPCSGHATYGATTLQHSILGRFVRKTTIRVDGCWEWQAGCTSRGYGQFAWPRGSGPAVTGLAHRFSYEYFIGPIPAGLELDHLCRNHACVRPDHLEPVTHAENVRRGDCGKQWAAKTQCPQGHPYNGSNLYVYPDGRRACRTCDRTKSRDRQRQKRAAV